MSIGIGEGIQHSKEITKRIKMIIGMTGLKYTQFAEVNNLKLATLKNWIYASNFIFTFNAAQRLVEAASKCGVQVTTTWIMRGIGSQPRAETVLFSDVLQQRLYEQNMDFNKEIRHFGEARSDHITLLVSDDSLEPIYDHGDYIGGQLFYGEDIKLIVGRLCIVKVYDYPIMCRRLILDRYGKYELRLVNLFSDVEHAIVQDFVLEAAAPVTRCWRELTLLAAVPE